MLDSRIHRLVDSLWLALFLVLNWCCRVAALRRVIERILSATAPETLLRLQRQAHMEGRAGGESAVIGGLVPAFAPRPTIHADAGPPCVPRR